MAVIFKMNLGERCLKVMVIEQPKVVYFGRNSNIPIRIESDVSFFYK
jgi:hypothetical protein